MTRKELSLTGALAGGLAGWVAEVAIQEVTGHHVTTGVLELVGAAAGLWRLDRRVADALRDTLDRAKSGEEDDYRQVKQRIEELTQDLPELREILSNMVDAGIQAQKA
jgi:DNA-binding ferritin-like protein (Dps family)